MAEIAAHGYDSPRGRSALRVVNRAHAHYAISNDDMLYVLSTFIYDPIAWVDRYGWRPLHAHERLAAFHYYREVGARMGIRDIPDSFAHFEDFKQRYEQSRFAFAPSNREVGDYTVALFAAWFPRFLRPAARAGVRSMLTPAILHAFGMRPAPPGVGAVLRAGLRARAIALRWLFPPRTRSALAVMPRNRSYPGYPSGYHPEMLGAPPPGPDIPAHCLRNPGHRRAEHTAPPSRVPPPDLASHPAPDLPSQHPAPNPATHPPSHPAADPATNPPSHPATNPPSHPAPDPATHTPSHPTPDPATNPPSHPTADPATHTPSHPTPDPATNPPSHPAPDPATNPPSHPAPDPATHTPSHPTADAAPDPPSHPTPDPATNSPSQHPAPDPATHTPSHPAADPATNPPSHPAAGPAQDLGSIPASHPAADPASSADRASDEGFHRPEVRDASPSRRHGA
ncbi:hypothetical protein J2S41_000573 [Catenuloplanes atrovinosus]|uniref:ER-bound oxygenase mpaB/mpaB'/Rubber oxygenase catalytic domain-containing protein n=2 Tax=Catenuloplanes atrovinosus TaxID=137266 RepID=A0AAE4C9P1_9ACTN|nr:hypothetical protein [Catenuloplanes atrovinosus]